MIGNLIVVSGNVVAAPVRRTTGGGAVVTNVRVASNEQKLNRETGQWETVSTSYYNVSCWKTLGERVAACIRRGDPVFFIGRPQVREFERAGGQIDHSVDVSADYFGVDLHMVWVKVLREHPDVAASRSSAQPAAEDPFAADLPAQPVAARVAEPAA